MKKVVSSARKLRFQPQPGAPVVRFPEGAILSDYGVNNETPTIVVCNGTENPPSWQGVSFGTGVVLVNEVPEPLALQALDLFEQEGKTNRAIGKALEFLASAGCVDQYTSPLAFQPKLSPAGRMVDDVTGIVKRDERDLTPCWREGGNLYVLHEKQPKLMGPDILLRTYRNPDGTPIDLATIPERQPEEVAVA